MSFYDDASLVVIPSGYKTSKVYAEKPTDGSGDLTFTRTGDTATRVGPDGLIQEVRTNLVLQSEAFNTTWVPSRGAVTANATTAPNGTTTADKFVPDTQVNPHFISQAISGLTNGGIYTSSVYAKASEWNSIAIFRGDSAIGVSFRLDTQATSVVIGTPTTYSITDAGNGWYRCSVSFAIASTSDGAQIRVGNNGAFSIAGDNINGLFLWGAQYEISDFGATSYIPTTTAAVSVGPVANVPRLDYLGSTCPRLLLEPQRTNLALYSEQFDNAAWDETGVSVTANNTTSPDGTQNADKIIEDSSNGIHLFYNLNPIVGAATSTASIFYKKGTRRYFSIKLQIGSNSYTQVYDAEGVTTGANSSNGLTSVSTSIVSMGNGWIRATLTGTDPLGLTATYMIVSLSNSATPTFDPSNKNPTYQGTGTDNGFIWGAQLEAGAYATSYIPTLAASATRGADACSKTGISSLIGQTEGVAFIDFVWNGLTGVGSYPRIIELATDANNIIQLYSIAGTTTWGWDIFNGGVVQFTGSSTMALGRNKIAIGYKLNDMVVYQNGTLLASDTSCTVPATSALGVTGIFNGAGGAQLAASVNQTLLFKTRLTNAELAELTTL